MKLLITILKETQFTLICGFFVLLAVIIGALIASVVFSVFTC